MKKILSLFIVMTALFALSCGGNNSNTAKEDTTVAIEAPASDIVVVTVEDLLGKEYSLTNMYEGKEVTIAFSDTNMLGGKSAVNSYVTEFSLDGNKIKLNALGSTKMMGPEEDMAVETEYLQILNGADTISLDGDVLTITTASGTNLIYTFKGNVETASENAN
ncbi:META domain-containing protein [Brachyspira hampsonii]|uniref:Heat-shock protein n=1 Tax=Brachyspira hampsonii TaxID=1287055 RepID=A0AAC9TU09_9SPIR|nr:META domain-containing protein [Brachyspira hampsonii]ASJ20732.1 heat-shock protein [Brachyspira hampsonii]ELV06606.1 Heat shock protein [Brachyspira hampsonii 30599]MBW5381204.1 META domain-containing protein [Brachyspira hampsonii]MBW5411099.1 META domain-containing protein [Brachyspira hampsonii]OEJ18090.1 heat-shock protein [Brachyspira hampsonii]